MARTELNTRRTTTIFSRIGAVAAAAGLALTFTACVVPAPPIESSNALGLVRAEDQFHADLYSGLVAELQPRISEVLPGTLDRTTEVWIQESLAQGAGKPAPANVKGFTLIDSHMNRGRIHLRQDNEYPRWFLTHELVHALLGPQWLPLPGVLEEGLCDLVAAKLNPDCAPRIRALRAIEASIFFGKMKVVIAHKDGSGRERTDSIWFHYDRGPSELGVAQVLSPSTLDLKRRFERVPDTLYGLGFLVAQRIEQRGGFQKLFDLCEQANDAGEVTVPIEGLLEAAGMSGDNDELAQMSFDLLGREEFDHWVDLLPQFHGDLLTQLFHDRYRESSAEAFLERAEPTLILADGTRIALGDDARVRAALRSAWSLRSNTQR